MAISLIGPDGHPYEMDDPAKVAAAEKLGYRVVTPEAPVTLAEQATGLGTDVSGALEAGTHGALQGLSAGLFGAAVGRGREADESDAAYKVRQFDAAEMNRGKEEHPIASGIGELAGMVLSPINKVGLAVKGGLGATTALGRIGATALGSGAEGLLYGAGNTLSDAALGDQDLTAEKMVAGVGLGGVLGLVGGGIGGGLAEGFKAVLPAAGRLVAAAKGPLSDFAENRWLKAAGGIQSDIKNIPEGERGAVAQVIRDAMAPAGKALPASLDEAASAVALERDAVARQLMKEIGVGDAGGLLPKMDKEEAIAALGRGFKENGDRMGAVLAKADEMGARPSFSGALRRFDELEASLNPAERDIIEADLARARKYVLEMGSAPAGSPKNSFAEMNSLKSTLQGDINWADTGAKNGLKKKLVGIIKDELDSQFAAQMGPNLAKEFQEAKAAYGALKQAAKAVKGKNATGADAINALVKDASLAAPNLGGKLSALEHATKLIRHGLDRQLGNRFISPSDYAAGIAGGLMHPLGALAALPAAIGHKIIREKGPAVIAQLADSIAQSPRLQLAATSFGNQLQAAAPRLGAFGPPLLQAFAQSPARGLATHMTWAQASPDYAEAAQAAGFLPETPQESAHAEAKGNTLAAVAHTLDTQSVEMGRAIDHVLKGKVKGSASPVLSSQDFGAKRMRRDTVAAHQQRVTEIRELVANPEALIDRVAANMGETGEMAPGVAAAMTRTAATAVQFLASEIKEPQKAGPLAPEWVPSNAEISQFSSVLETVQDPMSVLRHASNGTLTEDKVRALNAVYPRLGRQISDQVLDRLAAGPKLVPYKSRLMLSMLTGIDVDGTLSPEAVARNQSAIRDTNSRSTGAPQPPGERNTKLTLGSRTALPNQQREMNDAGGDS